MNGHSDGKLNGQLNEKDERIWRVRFPLLKNSTALCEITDRDGNVVGRIHRYHATRLQRIVNLLLTNMVNNVFVTDRDGAEAVNIVEVNTPAILIREKWEVRVRGGRSCSSSGRN